MTCGNGPVESWPRLFDDNHSSQSRTTVTVQSGAQLHNRDLPSLPIRTPRRNIHPDRTSGLQDFVAHSRPLTSSATDAGQPPCLRCNRQRVARKSANSLRPPYALYAGPRRQILPCAWFSMRNARCHAYADHLSRAPIRSLMTLYIDYTVHPCCSMSLP